MNVLSFFLLNASMLHGVYLGVKNLDTLVFIGSEVTFRGEELGEGRRLWEKLPEEGVCYSWENIEEKEKLIKGSKKSNGTNSGWVGVMAWGGVCNLGSALLAFLCVCKYVVW